MHGSGHPRVDWRDLAAAVPGGVAVQRGEQLVSVSDDLAELCGVAPAALVDEPWRALFATEEAQRVERVGISEARATGRWTGTARTGGDLVAERPVELSIAAGEDALVWVVDEREDPERDPLPDPGDRYRPLMEAAPVPIWVQREETLVYLNDAAANFFGAESPEAVVGRSDLAFVVPSERERSLERNRRILEDGEVLPVMEGRKVGVDGQVRHGLYAGARIRFEGEDAILVIARDITERKRRTRELQRQRDELATLDRINELLLETTRELIQSSSREAVERTVCEQLAASDLYQFAWVAEREPGGDRIVPRVTAGSHDGYLDAVTGTGDAGESPVARALRTGEVAAVNVGESSAESWRAAAAERGFESVAAVPLRHEGAVYGVLGVYATREDAFSEREQAGFGVLGRTVGFVVHAARSRELLFSDAVVELEFRVEGSNDTIAATAAALDCELALDGYVTAGDQWLLYLAVDGAAPASVAADLLDRPGVEGARPIGDDRIELLLESVSLLETASSVGATVRSATATPAGTRLVVEAPATADVRTVVDRLSAAYPAVELLARRERDREVTTVGRAGGPLDELTDRQREVLEAAYRAGYFGWPRESTAEEVADSLGIASATLHNHLRRAEQKILATLLED